MSTCTICTAQLPERSDAYACRSCAYRIRAMLRELPLQLPLLEASLEQERGPAIRGGNRAHAPLPLRGDTIDLIGPGQSAVIADPHGDQVGGIPIAGCLKGWAQFLAADFPVVWPGPDGEPRIVRSDGPWPRHGVTIPAWCAWLSAYTSYAITRPWVGVFHDELDTVVQRARSITRTEPRRMPKLAPCPACDAFALVETDGEWYIDCTACPRRLTREEYREHAESVLPGLSRMALAMLATELQIDAHAAGNGAA